MFVLGLHVGTEGSRWSIRGVLLDPANDAVSSIVIEHFPDKRHDEATQAREAHDAVASALRGHQVSAAVLREADYHPRQKITDGAKRRLRLEGACLAACRATGMQVDVKNGQEIGAAYGGKKGDAFDAARDLGVDEKLVDAAAAALSAKSLI